LLSIILFDASHPCKLHQLGAGWQLLNLRTEIALAEQALGRRPLRTRTNHNRLSVQLYAESGDLHTSPCRRSHVGQCLRLRCGSSRLHKKFAAYRTRPVHAPGSVISFAVVNADAATGISTVTRLQ